MYKITVIPNSTRSALIGSTDYNCGTLRAWLKRFKSFELVPIINESVKSRRYLEGAVIPAYCEWQYSVDPRDGSRDEQRRFLFKRDFNYEVVTNRQGKPVRSPVSSKGKAVLCVKKYTTYAEQNGAPIPNPELFKLWRDKWSNDIRFPTFFDFLAFLGLDCDAMPSTQTLSVLGQFASKVNYPEGHTPTAFED